MTDFAEGGYIPGPVDLSSFPPEHRQLHPNECLIGPNGECVRPDHAERHGASDRRETP